MVRDYNEGAKVKITGKTLEIIKAHSNSINGPLSASYMKVLETVKDLEGTVTRRFKPGYEFNVEWNIPYERDDKTFQATTILQVKDHWVEPLDNNWKEV